MKKIKYNLDLLKIIAERDKCLINFNDYNNIRLNRELYIKFICSCKNSSEKIFRCMYNTGSFCRECMNKIKNTKFKKTNLEKYGVEYTFQNNEIKEKSKKTNLERYGVEHSSRNETVKEKLKKTNLEKYGVENTFQNQEIKEKIKNVILEKYGEEHFSRNEEIKEKIKNTNLKKYGVEHVFQNEEIKQQIKNTNLKKYGVENSFQNEEIKEKIKQTCLKKYGVQNPAQNAEISEKTFKNSYKLKEFIFPCGNIIQIQGYEHFALDELVKNGYKFEDIITNRQDVPCIWYNKNNGKKSRYFCDIYISKEKKIIEVKSLWTYEKDKEDLKYKKEACISKGYNFELQIYNYKGENINKIIDTPVLI